MATCSCNTNADGNGRVIRDEYCSVHGDDAQPEPVNTDDALPIAHQLVQHDLQARLDFGLRKYGTPLRPHNGRDSLRDAYEELLDGACYLRNALYERDGK